jgi:hypothetical protein
MKVDQHYKCARSSTRWSMTSFNLLQVVFHMVVIREGMRYTMHSAAYRAGIGSTGCAGYPAVGVLKHQGMRWLPFDRVLG